MFNKLDKEIYIMRYLPFIAFTLALLSACSKDDIEDIASTRSGTNADSTYTEQGGVTITIDTT